MTRYVLLPGDEVTLRVPASVFEAHLALAVVIEQEDAPPVAPPAPGLPWEDVTATFPTNPQAQNPPASPGRWATRRPVGITVHHTGSHDPYALARACLGKAYVIGGRTYKGLPTTQYHIFIHADGRALVCVPLEQAGWHDHGGYPNSNISIGLAGYWHKQKPPAVVVESLARVCAHVMREYAIPRERVVGHRDRARAVGVGTECPGWDAAPIGAGWRGEFDAALTAALAR